MKVGIVTLFPELFSGFLETSFVARALKTGAVQLEFESLREHGLGNYKAVDDTPYGGGAGMVLRVDCVVDAVEALEQRLGERSHRVLLTPQGTPLVQSGVVGLSQRPSLLFICGRYEGFDERVRHFVDEEISLGDFVLTGGEVAAMACLDACVRLLPGVLGNAESVSEESFSGAEPALEYPQYTRPVEFRGLGVPDVLSSGNHQRIREWREQQAQQRTRERRPDLELRRDSKGKS